jgi:hypothetical protein
MVPILVTLELPLAQPILQIIKSAVLTLTHDQWKSQIEPIVNALEMSIGNAIKAHSIPQEPLDTENKK